MLVRGIRAGRIVLPLANRIRCGHDVDSPVEGPPLTKVIYQRGVFGVLRFFLGSLVNNGTRGRSGARTVDVI